MSDCAEQGITPPKDGLHQRDQRSQSVDGHQCREVDGDPPHSSDTPCDVVRDAFGRGGHVAAGPRRQNERKGAEEKILPTHGKLLKRGIFEENNVFLMFT
jgi:hypothetical protein